MKTLAHNLKIATMIPAKAYGATENFSAVDLLGLVQATGTLTIATNPTNGDTIVIGSRTYTFQDTLTNVDGHVKIGANAAATQVNLVHAIMLNGGTVGTDYATAMTKHAYVTISDFSTNVATVTAKSAGTDGNSLATTDTLTAAADGFAAATLTGGKDDIASCDSALVLLSIGDITGTPTSYDRTRRRRDHDHRIKRAPQQPAALRGLSDQALSPCGSHLHRRLIADGSTRRNSGAVEHRGTVSGRRGVQLRSSITNP
jgi:hypothetical protein